MPRHRSKEPAGVVLGSLEATPLDFWVGVKEGQLLQLDDLITLETETPFGQKVRFYGVVDVVRKKYEGTSFDSDAFRVSEGILPADISYAAHVQVTRIEPEIFIPPSPGDPVFLAQGEAFERALYFDQMEKKVAIGLTRTGEPVYANLDFIDGTRGAHLSVTGVSGIATKTTYALFILYSLFHSGALGQEASSTHAIIFNVKGEDLLWLDFPNAKLDEKARREYRKLGLEVGPFQSVAFYAPPRKGAREIVVDVGSRQEGVLPYFWTMRQFCQKRLLRYCFTDAEEGRSQLSFAIARIEEILEKEARKGSSDDPTVTIFREGEEPIRLSSFHDLVQLLEGETLEQWVPKSIATAGTLSAFRRRLHAADERLGHLIQAPSGGMSGRIDWRREQVTVVDIHTLHAQAQRFVVGVLLSEILAEKERKGQQKPLVFILLDELNKYAPREGRSPIRDLLLDIAERGRSLGLSLFGCQQTASEIERRIISNAALKAVGRLDPAEAERSEYGFLTPSARLRAKILRPGTMIVAQPDLPTPLLVRFPFPCWATRKSEVHRPPRDLFSRVFP